MSHSKMVSELSKAFVVSCVDALVVGGRTRLEYNANLRIIFKI